MLLLYNPMGEENVCYQEVHINIIISKKGTVVIPAELRKKYSLEPGKAVQLVDYGGVLAILPVSENPVQDAYGMLAHKGRRLTDILVEEHRRQIMP